MIMQRDLIVTTIEKVIKHHRLNTKLYWMRLKSAISKTLIVS